MALNASQAISEALGDVLWTARAIASMASLDEMRGTDPAPMMNQARTRGRFEYAGDQRGVPESRSGT